MGNNARKKYLETSIREIYKENMMEIIDDKINSQMKSKR